MRRLDARQPSPRCPAVAGWCTTLPLSSGRRQRRRRRVRAGTCGPDARRRASIAGPRGLVMSAVWDDQALLEPISAEQPCGQNLDEAPVLPGRKPPSSPSSTACGCSDRRDRPKRRPIRTRASVRARRSGRRSNGIGFATRRSKAWAKSKDLRLLAYLGTALLRTDGLPAFCDGRSRSRRSGSRPTGRRCIRCSTKGTPWRGATR